MGYFLDFVYSHEKTNRNLIDKFKCIIQWNTKISSLSLSLSLSSLSSKNSLKKIKGEIKTKKQRTNSDIYLRNWQIGGFVNAHCACVTNFIIAMAPPITGLQNRLIYFVRFEGL